MNIGKEGELLFQEIMRNKGYIVEDVSGDPQYWKEDIDCFCTSPVTGLTKSFEIKYDSRINKTNNLYLELTNIYSKQWGRRRLVSAL